MLYTPVQLVAAMHQIISFPAVFKSLLEKQEAYMNCKTTWGHYYSNTKFFLNVNHSKLYFSYCNKIKAALLLLMLRKVSCAKTFSQM